MQTSNVKSPILSIEESKVYFEEKQKFYALPEKDLELESNFTAHVLQSVEHYFSCYTFGRKTYTSDGCLIVRLDGKRIRYFGTQSCSPFVKENSPRWYELRGESAPESTSKTPE